MMAPPSAETNHLLPVNTERMVIIKNTIIPAIKAFLDFFILYLFFLKIQGIKLIADTT